MGSVCSCVNTPWLNLTCQSPHVSTSVALSISVAWNVNPAVSVLLSEIGDWLRGNRKLGSPDSVKLADWTGVESGPPTHPFMMHS